VQQNIDGSSFFDRTWNEFKVGFGDTSGNYWLGNDELHQLTSTGRYKLRVDLQSRDNSQWYWAEYNTFTVGSESEGYRLHVDDITGNVNIAADKGILYHNGMQFTTKDRDNDEDTT